MKAIVASRTVSATRSAMHSAPAAEIPAKMPSSAAIRRAIASASAWLTFSIRSTRERSKIFGR